MSVDSVYIVQSQIIQLGKGPFEIEKRNIRNAFRPIFTSPDCFTKMRTSILSGWERPIPLPPLPFISCLGQVCFNTRSVRLSPEARWRLVESFGGEKYWDPQEKYERTNREKDNTDIGFIYDEDRDIFFGYDESLEDQRMNYLYFEIRRPLFIKATLDRRVVADGNVFIHIYPSGYLVLHLAIALKQHKQWAFSELRTVLRETRPGSSNTRWIWWSRLGTGDLAEIVKIVKENTLRSIFENPPSIKSSDWFSALKISSEVESEKIVSLFLKGGYDCFEFSCVEYMLSSRQGLICCFSPFRKRKSALRLFWKILVLYEFVLLKNFIYETYADLLRSEILKLREFRLSPLRKLIKEDIRHFSVFNPLIPQYLFALDKHIRSAKPFHRRVYSSISQGMGFDARREKVKELLKEWEIEVEQWEHSALLIWKTIIAPLRSLIGF